MHVMDRAMCYDERNLLESRIIAFSDASDSTSNFWFNVIKYLLSRDMVNVFYNYSRMPHGETCSCRKERSDHRRIVYVSYVHMIIPDQPMISYEFFTTLHSIRDISTTTILCLSKTIIDESRDRFNLILNFSRLLQVHEILCCKGRVVPPYYTHMVLITFLTKI